MTNEREEKSVGQKPVTMRTVACWECLARGDVAAVEAAIAFPGDLGFRCTRCGATYTGDSAAQLIALAAVDTLGWIARRLEDLLELHE